MARAKQVGDALSACVDVRKPRIKKKRWS